MQYKKDQTIIIRYLAIDNETGLTDLKLTPTNPSGVDQTPISLTEIEDGLYTVSFTPNVIGWWLVRVSSVLKPKNIYSKSYFVGTEYTTYPPQEDGKLTSLDTKVGEVQPSPTQYSLLGRLKDIYDKLVAGITATVDKVKLWDGIYEAKVDPTGRLLVSTQTVTPISATPVVQLQSGSVSGTANYFYIIPNGVTFTITKFAASSEVEQQAGNVVELYYAPNGNTIGIILIDTIYSSGNSDQHDLDVSYIGNGTRAILLRRRRLSGGAKEIFGRFAGYY